MSNVLSGMSDDAEGVRVQGTLAGTSASAALLLALAGCSSQAAEPKPLSTASVAPSPTATSSGTASASPTVSAPAYPAAARGTTEAAAKAFVRYWIKALNSSGASGDVAALRTYSDGCIACDAISDFIESVHAHGGWIHGEGWRTKTVDVTGAPSARALTVVAHVQVAAQAVKPSRNAQVRHFEGGARPKTFTIRLRAGGWKVTSLDQPE